MSVPGISINGIDPDGESPPDEVLLHPETGDATELVRGGDTSWEVRVYEGTELEHTRGFDAFEPAFSYFTEMVGVAEEVF